MDAFEVNKMAGAVLTALLVIFGSKTVLDIVYTSISRRSRAGPCRSPRSRAQPEGTRARSMPSAVLELLPKANAENGQDAFKKCLACHTPDKGGRTSLVPTSGASSAARSARRGFNYSDAMKKPIPAILDVGGTGRVSPQPRPETVPGNRMQFPGVT